MGGGGGMIIIMLWVLDLPGFISICRWKMAVGKYQVGRLSKFRQRWSVLFRAGITKGAWLLK